MSKHGGKRQGAGRKPHPDPKVSKKRIVLRGAMWVALEEEAARRNTTVNQVIESCVEQCLNLKVKKGIAP